MFERREPEPVKCPQCGGKGKREMWGDLEEAECYPCGGTGEVSAFAAVGMRASRIADMADDRQNETKTNQ